jgi:hypothetical protein
VIEEEDEEE